jgi:hypothetical protein
MILIDSGRLSFNAEYWFADSPPPPSSTEIFEPHKTGARSARAGSAAKTH